MAQLEHVQRPHFADGPHPSDADALPKATPEAISALKNAPFIARMLMRGMLKFQWGRMIVQLPDGQALCFEGSATGGTGILIVHDYAMARRVATGGNVGLAEAYLDGQWDSPDVTAMLEVFSQNTAHVRALFQASPLTAFATRILHTMRRNTKRQARRNIEAHYDLGNRFYETWLDHTMTYSSALFEKHTDDLATAQEAKYAALARSMDLQADHRVLEIGCGWGGFAEHAARTIGCHVTGITISKEQYDYARERASRAGLTDKIDIQYCDYRDVSGTFDRIASIEMFEAVGERYWPQFFETVRNRLAPEGQAGLQIITIADDHFESYRQSVDFIQRYIFPGGMLPSPEALEAQTARVGLEIAQTKTFGADYARTLAAWRARFVEAWPQVKEQGFDERFKRLWTYYLSYCEAGFRSGATNVCQMVLKRT